MTLVRCLTEMGMGVDAHGHDAMVIANAAVLVSFDDNKK